MKILLFVSILPAWIGCVWAYRAILKKLRDARWEREHVRIGPSPCRKGMKRHNWTKWRKGGVYFMQADRALPASPEGVGRTCQNCTAWEAKF